MIVTENGAAAFLKKDGKYLLMKRAAGRKVAPDVWSSVGGHIEDCELNNPYAACLREIEEETGIKPDNIFNLTLRYIIVRRHRDTIRINYIYFGETDVSDITDTYEGTLHWIPEKELMNRTFTKTFDAMLRHYLSNPNENKVIVGVAGSHNNECRMSWAKVEDFELK